VLDLPDGKKMAVESKYQSSGADKKCLSSFESKYPEIPTRVSCFECDTDVQSSVSPVYSF
jgi:hypothetical protein